MQQINKKKQRLGKINNYKQLNRQIIRRSGKENANRHVVRAGQALHLRELPGVQNIAAECGFHSWVARKVLPPLST